MNIYNTEFEKVKGKKTKRIFLYASVEDLHIRLDGSKGVFALNGSNELHSIKCLERSSPEDVLKSLCQAYRSLAVKSSGYRTLRKRVLNET